MDDARVVAELTDQPIRIADHEHRLTDWATGAHGWFSGVTRRSTEQEDGSVQVTRTLFYEGHETMAVQQLRRLGNEAVEQFGLTKAILIHRLGEVPLGEASVLIGCSSAHRVNVFRALPWIMDRLKEDVPIWKREHYEGESGEWIHPTS